MIVARRVLIEGLAVAQLQIAASVTGLNGTSQRDVVLYILMSLSSFPFWLSELLSYGLKIKQTAKVTCGLKPATDTGSDQSRQHGDRQCNVKLNRHHRDISR